MTYETRAAMLPDQAFDCVGPLHCGTYAEAGHAGTTRKWHFGICELPGLRRRHTTTTAERVAAELATNPDGLWDMLDSEQPDLRPSDPSWGTEPGHRATFGDGSYIEYHPGHFGGDWVAVGRGGQS